MRSPHFANNCSAGSANSSATCRGGRRVTRIASGFRKSCCNKPVSPPRSRITSDSRSAFRMFMRSPLRRRRKCCASGPVSVTTAARALVRLGAIHGDLREPQRWQDLQKKADRLLEPKSPGDWNQAVMELGATLCTPKSPQCLLCPVAQFCEGRRLGLAGSLPEKRKKRATVEVTLAAAVFADGKGQTLLFPAPKNTKEKASADHVPTLVSRMWHFPTLSVTGEPAAKLIAYLHKLIPGVRDSKWQLVPAGKVRHAVTYRAITLLPFLIIVEKLPRVPGARQVPLGDISSLPVSNLTRKVARAALAVAAFVPAKR